MSDRSLSDRKRVTVTMQKGALENEGGEGGDWEGAGSTRLSALQVRYRLAASRTRQ